MSKRKIYAIVFSTVAFICLSAFVWSYFVTKEIRENSQDALNKGQKVIVNNLVLTETKDNAIFWELWAKSGEYDSESGLVVLRDIVGNFYGKDNTVVLSFESPKGSYKELDKVIVLEGKTLVAAKDGSSITADRVVWRGKEDDIVASGNVQINRNSELITKSEKATFNSALTYFRIDGKCETRIFSEDSAPLPLKERK